MQEVSVSILKLTNQHLAIPLSILFSQFVNSDRFPQLWKHATVTTIHRKESKEELGNYCPVSSLITFPIFLKSYLDAGNIISPRQFGFQSGLGTSDALITFSEDITIIYSNRDFTKAFATRKHDTLLKRLHYYVIRRVIYDWPRDSWTQCMKLSKYVPTPKTIHFGAPQGGVLGPILCLLYINDLPNIFTNSKWILFADDATICVTGEDSSNITQAENNDLEALYTWDHKFGWNILQKPK